MYTFQIYSNHRLILLVLMVAGFLTFYLVIMACSFRKTLSTVFGKAARRDFSPASAVVSDDFISPLIDRPAPLSLSPQTVTQEQIDEEEMAAYEIFDDEQNVLLKEAEKVVEEIQDVVNHIASRPANPDEVFTKIRAIVCQYSLFENTEYYDAINSFVAITVQRDCDLELSLDDLKSLWQEAA